MPDLRLFPGANEPNDVRLYPLEDTTQDVYLYPGANEPNDVQLRPLGSSAPPLFSAGGATTYTISGNTAITFAVASAPADTFVEPAAAGLAFTVASGEASVFAEAGSTPLTFAVTAAFQVVAAAGTQPGGATRRRPVLLTLPGPEPARVAFAAAGSVLLGEFVVSAAVEVVKSFAAAVAAPPYAPRATVSSGFARTSQVRPQHVRAGAVMRFVDGPARRHEEDELVLVGVL